MSAQANVPAGLQGGVQRGGAGQYAAATGFPGHSAAVGRGGSLSSATGTASPSAMAGRQLGSGQAGSIGPTVPVGSYAPGTRQPASSSASSSLPGARPGSGAFATGSSGLAGADVASLFAKGGSAPPGLGAAATQPNSQGGSSSFGAPPGLFSTGLPRTADRDDGSSALSAPTAAQVPAVPPDAYGMAGLLGVLKAGDRDIPALALGTDLSAPGINLSAPSTSIHPLHALFGAPWAKEITPLEPHWSMPASYRMPQPALKTGHLAKFDVTTLMYIFYAMPRDVLQAYAAQELYAREWRFHRDHKVWFKGEQAGAGAGAGVGGKAGQGQLTWSYFDLPSWERRAWNRPEAILPSAFLTEEECRVKPTGAAPPGTAGAGQAGQATAV